MFNNIPEHSLHAGMESTHLRPDVPAVNDNAPMTKTTSSAGLTDTFSFEDFLSQRRESDQVQDKDRIDQHSNQDGEEVLKGLRSADDAANLNQIRSILEQLLRDICNEIIKADMLSISDIAKILLAEKVITAELYNALSKSLKICDQGAPDDQIDSSSVEYLYILFPYLYNQLAEIYLRRKPMVMLTCPRCGYVSDTAERICPKCGYIF